MHDDYCPILDKNYANVEYANANANTAANKEESGAAYWWVSTQIGLYWLMQLSLSHSCSSFVAITTLAILLHWNVKFTFSRCFTFSRPISKLDKVICVRKI